MTPASVDDALVVRSSGPQWSGAPDLGDALGHRASPSPRRPARRCWGRAASATPVRAASWPSPTTPTASASPTSTTRWAASRTSGRVGWSTPSAPCLDAPDGIDGARDRRRASRPAAADLPRLARGRPGRRPGAPGRPARGPLQRRARPAALPVVGRSRLRAADLPRDRPALRDLGRHPAPGRGPRRAARPDGQPHLAPERRVPGLRAPGPTVGIGGPLHHPRQGLAGRRPAGAPTSPASSCASPTIPFSTITIAETGEQETVWTSFGTSDWSEQVDLDLRSPTTRASSPTGWRFFASQGVRIVRLDAVGYVVKKPARAASWSSPRSGSSSTG